MNGIIFPFLGTTEVQQNISYLKYNKIKAAYSVLLTDTNTGYIVNLYC